MKTKEVEQEEGREPFHDPLRAWEQKKGEQEEGRELFHNPASNHEIRGNKKGDGSSSIIPSNHVDFASRVRALYDAASLIGHEYTQRQRRR